MTLCRVIAPFHHSPQIQARILIGSVRALVARFMTSAPRVATSALWVARFMTSAPLRKCTRRLDRLRWHRPPPLSPLCSRPHSALTARPLSARDRFVRHPLRATPFRSALRTSACLPSSGRPLPHHPAPPPSCASGSSAPKRQARNLSSSALRPPPLPLPHLVAATPPSSSCVPARTVQLLLLTVAVLPFLRV